MPNYTDIHLRPASIDDAKVIYIWQCQPETRKHFTVSTIPSWEQHITWIKNKLSSKTSKLFIIKADGQNAGLLRLDPFHDEHFHKAQEVSILVSSEFYGGEIATRALMQILRTHKNVTFTAHVKRQNNASIRLFEKCGFKDYKAEYYFIKSEA